jgi:hypothetical protein
LHHLCEFRLMELIRRLYHFITAPLYNKLLREVKAGMQSQIEAQIEYQTTTIGHIVDELTVINLQLEAYAQSPSELHKYLKELEKMEDKLSPETIHAVVSGLSKPSGLPQVMSAHGVSALAAIQMETKYHGMNVNAIRRVRQMAKENESLQNELERIREFAGETSKTGSGQVG